MQAELLPTIQVPLANKFYKANKARGTAKRNEQVWVVRNKGIIAACRIQTVAEHSLLVGLMVAEQARGNGVGNLLVSKVLNELKQSSSQPVFTFAYRHLVDWYIALGFKSIHGDQQDLTINKLEAVSVPDGIKEKFMMYKKQGRDIVLMKTEQL